MSLDPSPARLHIEGEPAALLVHVTESRELETFDQLLEGLRARAGGRGFAIAALAVSDWNADLSPWAAPPVFGREGFAGNAKETLDALLDRALPEIEGQLAARGVARGLPKAVGGYSLAGLFALWAFYQTGAFAGVAAASPSVWFPGWDDYADAHRPPEGGVACLSLGDRESRARNRQMATVGAAIERQQARFAAQGLREAALEWNPGNHFADPEGRTARAWAWVLARL